MRPDKPVLASLSAVLQHDLSSIERLNDDLQAYIPRLQRDVCEFRDLAAAAYLLHNIYNALENTFAQISRTFENHVTDPVHRPKELLEKMFLEIPEIRAAVLPEHLRKFLNDLRGFRHLFRHSYDFDLDRDRLVALLENWRRSKPALIKALADFRNDLLRQVRANQG